MQRFECEEFSNFCPYCGSNITLLIDTSLNEHNYIEDCEVCCSPIMIYVELNDIDSPEITLLQENEIR